LETSNLLLVAGKYFEILMSLKYFFSLLLGCLKIFSSEVCTNFSLMMEFLHMLGSSGRSCSDEQKSFHFSPDGAALTLEA
jgi:hypothetical protein